MNSAKIILHSTSTNSGILRGGTHRAASSSFHGQAGMARENLQSASSSSRSTSPSSPRAFFHSSSSKPATTSLFDSSSLNFLVEHSNSSANNATTAHSTTTTIGRKDTPSRSSSESSTELSTSSSLNPESPPLLLLEGDNYHVSREGVARTLYRMRSLPGSISPNSTTTTADSLPGVLTVEEQYDLRNARKKFVLRRDNNLEEPSIRNFGEVDPLLVAVGDAIQEVDLQEIEAGQMLAADGAGTGATTWESSILMAMHFASRPEILLGEVVELGSGVGLGGILCALGPKIVPAMETKRTPRTTITTTGAKSFTLTDVNPMVLEQCRKNVQTIHEEMGAIPLHVSKLDWYDFLQPRFEKLASAAPRSQLFDTVIACDCAYRRRDIAALAATMIALLRDEHSHIHIFGPSNRCGLDELLTLLREEYQLNVTVQPLEMERYRLRPPSNEGRLSDLVDSATKPHECHSATSSVSNFLHIICSPHRGQVEEGENLSDID